MEMMLTTEYCWKTTTQNIEPKFVKRVKNSIPFHQESLDAKLIGMYVDVDEIREKKIKNTR